LFQRVFIIELGIGHNQFGQTQSSRASNPLRIGMVFMYPLIEGGVESLWSLVLNSFFCALPSCAVSAIHTRYHFTQVFPGLWSFERNADSDFFVLQSGALDRKPNALVFFLAQ
jgi:hypothetical protein